MRFFWCLKQVQRLKASWQHTSTKTSIECPLPHPLENVGRFPFTKNIFRPEILTRFTCPVERYIPVTQTQPKPPRVWLLFLWAGYKRAVLGATILSNGKGHFGITGQVKVDHLQSWSWIFRSEWYALCDVPMTEISGILGWMEGAC